MKGINTNLLHGYPVIDDYTGAASIPKYQVTTFDQKKGIKIVVNILIVALEIQRYWR